MYDLISSPELSHAASKEVSQTKKCPIHKHQSLRRWSDLWFCVICSAFWFWEVAVTHSSRECSKVWLAMLRGSLSCIRCACWCSFCELVFWQHADRNQVALFGLSQDVSGSGCSVRRLRFIGWSLAWLFGCTRTISLQVVPRGFPRGFHHISPVGRIGFHRLEHAKLVCSCANSITSWQQWAVRAQEMTDEIRPENVKKAIENYWISLFFSKFLNHACVVWSICGGGVGWKVDTASMQEVSINSLDKRCLLG